MFQGCKSLISIDLSNFNTQKVTQKCFIVSGCSSLTICKLPNFDSQDIKDKMKEMLYNDFFNK